MLKSKKKKKDFFFFRSPSGNRDARDFQTPSTVFPSNVLTKHLPVAPVAIGTAIHDVRSCIMMSPDTSYTQASFRLLVWKQLITNTSIGKRILILADKEYKRNIAILVEIAIIIAFGLVDCPQQVRGQTSWLSVFCGVAYIILPSLIARFMGPTWGPSGADRAQVVPMLAPWISLSGLLCDTGQVLCF